MSSLEEYIKNKKIHEYRSKPYYKVKEYHKKYFIPVNIIQSLKSGQKDVLLEINANEQPLKGIIKWDPVRKKIMISESKVRIMFKPFDIE